MENLFIKDSFHTPEVDFNATTGDLKISGESFHENSLEYFEPIFNWLNQYTNQGGKSITLSFRLNYFNTSSSRRFLEIMSILEDYHLKMNEQVTINWYYEKSDLDTMEKGEEYAKDIKLPFNIIPY